MVILLPARHPLVPQPVGSLSLRAPAMRAAVVPVPVRAAIARAAASGTAPPLLFASEGHPTTHGASCGAAAQSGKRKRDEEPMGQVLSLLPTPVAAAPSQRAVHLVPAPSSNLPHGETMTVTQRP
eukprot:scaffold12087_cov135-Isochrysis_galbana.AAC.2